MSRFPARSRADVALGLRHLVLALLSVSFSACSGEDKPVLHGEWDVVDARGTLRLSGGDRTPRIMQFTDSTLYVIDNQGGVDSVGYEYSMPRNPPFRVPCTSVPDCKTPGGARVDSVEAGVVNLVNPTDRTDVWQRGVTVALGAVGDRSTQIGASPRYLQFAESGSVTLPERIDEREPVYLLVNPSQRKAGDWIRPTPQ